MRLIRSLLAMVGVAAAVFPASAMADISGPTGFTRSAGPHGWVVDGEGWATTENETEPTWMRWRLVTPTSSPLSQCVDLPYTTPSENRVDGRYLVETWPGDTFVWGLIGTNLPGANKCDYTHSIGSPTAPPDSIILWVDTTPPVASIGTPSINGNKVWLRGTATDNASGFGLSAGAEGRFSWNTVPAQATPAGDATAYDPLSQKSCAQDADFVFLESFEYCGIYGAGSLWTVAAPGTYTFTLTAKDQAGNEASTSREVLVPAWPGYVDPAATPPKDDKPAQPAKDTRRPSKPSGLRVSRSGRNFVTFSWARASDDSGRVASYRLYRRVGAAWRYLGLVRQPTAARQRPSYTLRGLARGGRYGVALEAVDPTGNRSLRSTWTVRTTS